MWQMRRMLGEYDRLDTCIYCAQNPTFPHHLLAVANSKGNVTGLPERSGYTYESADVHPVWVYFTARCALHLEGIVVWIIGGIFWVDIGDPMHSNVPVIHTCLSSIVS